MPRELIFLQVGQCGNQIGCRFWEEALAEHILKGKSDADSFDDAMSSFFYISPTGQVKARAVPIDMEEGVLSSMMKGPLRHRFDVGHFVTDTTGCGNNWAVGHIELGEKYAEEIAESVRRMAEPCDSLQTFFFLHSLGGGTGSGVGTRMLSLLEDEFPHIFRFSCVVVPQVDDDVVTSPYNSGFAMKELINHADCVLPVDNAALAALATRLEAPPKDGTSSTSGAPPGKKKDKRGAFDSMNGIAARVLCHLTCSVRFPGTLNMDLNEITTNMVPYSKMHFLLSSATPVMPQRKRVDSMFMESLEQDAQLLPYLPRRYKYLACGLIVRGQDITVSEVHACIGRMRSKMDMVYWNSDGFKVAMCDRGTPTHPLSLLSISNNCCMADVFQRMSDNFVKLYRPRAHTHHYTPYIGIGEFEECLHSLADIGNDYAEMNRLTEPTEAAQKSLKEFLV